MKQLKFFATLFVAALSFASCMDDETPKFVPSPSTVLGEGAKLEAVIRSMIGRIMS